MRLNGYQVRPDGQEHTSPAPALTDLGKVTDAARMNRSRTSGIITGWPRRGLAQELLPVWSPARSIWSRLRGGTYRHALGSRRQARRPIYLGVPRRTGIPSLDFAGGRTG